MVSRLLRAALSPYTPLHSILGTVGTLMQSRLIVGVEMGVKGVERRGANIRQIPAEGSTRWGREPQMLVMFPKERILLQPTINNTTSAPSTNPKLKQFISGHQACCTKPCVPTLENKSTDSRPG